MRLCIKNSILYNNMSVPDSFCTIATNSCYGELLLFLYSLSIYHKNAKVYVYVDTKIYNKIQQELNILELEIHLYNILDKYSIYNREEMIKQNIWTEFQMMKAHALITALETNNNVMYLDSDIIILDTINIPSNYELIVSPHYVKLDISTKYGMFNGGLIYISNKNIALDWIEYSKTSRFYDQACIEELVKKYNNYKLGENYNVGWWRMEHGLTDKPTFKRNFKVSLSQENKQQIYYKGKILKMIHTHFFNNKYAEFNNYIISLLLFTNSYKELLLLYRLKNNGWTIRIPKQPQSGQWYHKNDSFRELCTLWSKNAGVKIIESNDKNCYLAPNILLYDRPTPKWIDTYDILNASIMLIGNDNVTNVKQKIKQQIIRDKIYNVHNKNIKIKPWIFWPRNPKILEQFISQNNSKAYNERIYNITFIGNIENEIQNNNRTPLWNKYIDNFHLTYGHEHKFTQIEYLMQLASSKYGLCLPGYGNKCHREVELCAVGTVLLITPNVNTDSYIKPLIENVHYIKINNPSDINNINLTEEQWQIMSNNCKEWYMSTIHSKNSFNFTIKNILYT